MNQIIDFSQDFGKENYCLGCVGAFARLAVPLVNNRAYWIFQASHNQPLNLRKIVWPEQHLLPIGIEKEGHAHASKNSPAIFLLPCERTILSPTT